MMSWISVQDRLPEEGGKYWIADKYGTDEAMYYANRKEWKSTDRPLPNAYGKQTIRQDVQPTHWMPLPKPPQE